MDNDNISGEPASDTVGYKKPPKSTQFKKGQSGNPKGRPPTKAFHQILEQVLNEKIIITANGEKQEVTKKEAIILRLANECMNGKSTANKTLVYLLHHFQNIWPI